jgi:hypothetical protein
MRVTNFLKWRSCVGLRARIGLCLMVLGTVAEGATIRVRQDGTGNYTNIQAAVNAMAARDTCLVGPGLYPERISFPTGKSGNATTLTTIKAETNGTVEMWGFDTRNCNYLHIEGFNITVPTNFTSFPNNAGLALRSSNLNIASNYIHDALAYGLYGYGNYNSNHLIGNRISNVCQGLVMFGTNWLVECNDFERLRYTGVLDDADYIIFFGVGHVIRSNFLHGTFQAEIGPAHVDGFSSWDNNGEYIQHIRIEANRMQDFYHQGFIAAARYYTNSFDITICNNQFIKAASWGVLAFYNLREVKIYNNLFKDIYSNGVGINQNATGEVKNNIFYNVTAWDSATSATNGSKNIWYRPGATLGSRFNGDLVNVNPQFVDVTNGNFHLRWGSPGIDTGLTVSNLPVDLESVSRPQGGGFDIGPYEYRITPPRLLAPQVQNGLFVLTVSGDAGRTYGVLTSTNLQQWSQVTNVTLTNATAVVAAPTNGSRAFYRAKLLP